jgi:hypothetical protein
MCKDCKIRFCKDCIENNYLELNKTECPNPNCQKKNRLDEYIPIPWFNEISNYIINQENDKFRDGGFGGDFNKNNEQKNINEINFQQLCEQHNSPYNKYCINCSKKLCSDCLSIFNENSKIHERHEIINIKEISEYDLENVLINYKNINEKKKNFDNNLEFIENCKKILEVIKNNKLEFINKYKNNIEKNYENIIENLNNLKNNQQYKEKEFNKSIPKVENVIRKLINEKKKDGQIIMNLSNKLLKFEKELEDKNIINDINNNLINNTINIEYFESNFLVFENLSLKHNFENLLISSKEFNNDLIPNFKITINLIFTFIENKINFTILFEKLNQSLDNKMFKIFLYIYNLKTKQILNFKIPNIVNKKNINDYTIKYSKLLNKNEINSCLDFNNNLTLKLSFEKE